METSQVPAPVVRQKNNIPVWIWLIAIWFFLSALAAFWNFAGIFFTDGPIGSEQTILSLLVYSICLTIVCVIAGINLLRLKNWARILALIIIGFSMLDTLFVTIQSTYPYLSISDLILKLVFTLAIPIIIAWYLIRVKEIFSPNG